MNSSVKTELIEMILDYTNNDEEFEGRPNLVIGIEGVQAAIAILAKTDVSNFPSLDKLKQEFSKVGEPRPYASYPSMRRGSALTKIVSELGMTYSPLLLGVDPNIDLKLNATKLGNNLKERITCHKNPVLVNQKVREITNGLIPGILDTEPSSSKLMIVSRTALLAEWRNTFVYKTTDLFHISKSKSKIVRYYHAKTWSKCIVYKGDYYEAVLLSLTENPMGPCVILAKPYNINFIPEIGVTTKDLNKEMMNRLGGLWDKLVIDIIKKGREDCIDLIVPLFKVTTTNLNLVAALSHSGCNEWMDLFSLGPYNVFDDTVKGIQAINISIKTTASIDFNSDGIATKSRTEILCNDQISPKNPSQTSSQIKFDKPFVALTVDPRKSGVDCVFDIAFITNPEYS